MYNLFVKKDSLAYVLCVVVYILIGIQLWYTIPASISKPQEWTFLSTYIPIHTFSKWIQIVIIWIIITIVGILIYNIFKKLHLSTKSTILPILLWGTQCTISLVMGVNVYEVVIVLILAIICNKLILTSQKNQTSITFYEIGFLYGCMHLVASYSIFFIIPMMLSVNIFGKNGWRDYIGILMGVLSPIYLVLSLLYLTDHLYYLTHYIQSVTTYHIDWIQNGYYAILSVVLIQIFAAYSFIGSYNINSRKIFTVLHNFLFFVLIYWIMLSYQGTKINMILIFVSTFYSISFVISNRNLKLKNIMIFLALILAIINTFVF